MIKLQQILGLVWRRWNYTENPILQPRSNLILLQQWQVEAWIYGLAGHFAGLIGSHTVTWPTLSPLSAKLKQQPKANSRSQQGLIAAAAATLEQPEEEEEEEWEAGRSASKCLPPLPHSPGKQLLMLQWGKQWGGEVLNSTSLPHCYGLPLPPARREGNAHSSWYIWGWGIFSPPPLHLHPMPLPMVHLGLEGRCLIGHLWRQQLQASRHYRLLGGGKNTCLASGASNPYYTFEWKSQWFAF